MKKIIAPLVLALLSISSICHASDADLTTLVFGAGTASNDSISPNLAFITNNINFFETVDHVLSFDYLYTTAGTAVGNFSIFHVQEVGINFIPLADSTSAGWVTYTFTSPFTGQLNFSLNNQSDDTSISVEIRNVSNDTVSPVPEPPTYALLLAGLGGIACTGWRQRRRARFSNVRQRFA